MFADELAQQLVDVLQRRQQKIVFAESCTAGLMAACCGRIAGVSEVLAGSAVVYQLATKTEWLGVRADTLQRCGAVSEIVCRQMAAGVLQMTPHADVSVSITGHLGPNAPAELDGIAWCGVAIRSLTGPPLISTQQFQLDSVSGSPAAAEVSVRHQRQQNAVSLVLMHTLNILVTLDGDDP